MASFRYRPMVALFAVALPLVACNPDPDAPIDPKTGVPSLYPEGGGTGPINSKSAALVQVGSCDQVADLLKQHLVAELVAQSQAAFASAWQSLEWCNKINLPSGGAMDAGAAMPSPSPTQPGAEPKHSETNNQVASVDEADIVKTDGNFIYLVSGGKLRILKSWPASTTSLVGSAAIEGTPKKLFIYEDRVLVYSSLDGGSGSGYPGYYGGGDCTYGYGCVPTGDGHPTKITIFDVKDRTSPKLVRELTLSSSLLAARRIGNAVHTVVTIGPRHTYFDPYPHTDSSPYGYSYFDVCKHSKIEIYNAYRDKLLQNIALLVKMPLGDIIPTVKDVVHTASGAVSNDSPIADCRSFLRSSLADGDQMTSVVSLAINAETPAKASTIISRPGVVYASNSALFLAEPRVRRDGWGWWEGITWSETTTLHKFELKSASAVYAASGIVKGRPLNQFSMDEHEGFVRIATTLREKLLTNTLTVLEQQGAALVTVGELNGIGPTEDIRSVRFDGPKGYVVTFKKTDPLFVLDLADPRKPSVLGELKIPGFSTYMHKMDDKHLLTIGYDGSDQGMFAWFTAVALQIFDVSNPTQPVLKWKHTIGTRGSSSEALTDHLAFTYYAPLNLLSLPMTICEGGDGSSGIYGTTPTFSGLMLFDVTAEKGFTEKGRVSFPTRDLSCQNWWTNATSLVKRSLIIETFVYSLTDTLLKVNDLANLATDLVSVPLQ